MKPAFDIHGLEVRTQLLLHAVLLLASLLIGVFLSFDVMFAWIPSLLFQWIAAIGVAKFLYFVFAYLLVGSSFVDPLERLFEESRKR